jgi:GT2 family glycosyltransferase
MLTVAIPTLNREQVLIETLRHVIAQEPSPAEILVLDQTVQHEVAVHSALSSWQSEGRIRWLRLPEPSVTKALNQALLSANCDIILFLDDDIIPAPGLVAAHLAAFERDGVGLVAGRITQPWQTGRVPQTHTFSFFQKTPAWIDEFMGGNFSIRREVALAVGGFDENFVRVGYRFEAEFAYRLRQAHHRIYFEPSAYVHHLKTPSGGTRTFGDHLRSYLPNHSVGDYYYQLRTWSGLRSLPVLLSRLPRAIANRHHLQRPWWIPATAVAEFSGLAWALFLALKGPRYLSMKQTIEHKWQ